MTPTEKAMREALELLADIRTQDSGYESGVSVVERVQAIAKAALATPEPGALERVRFGIARHDRTLWWSRRMLTSAPGGPENARSLVDNRSLAEHYLRQLTGFDDWEIVEVPTYRSPEEPAPR